MLLSSGTRLGHYDITAPLGAGGMGEVYKARDTRLGREVALKTLPESVTHDAERLARFKREAQILAALNHPHVAGIYGIEEIEGRHLLVLELVDGESLAERLRRGPLPVDEALAIGREIVLALEAAHERGIVHRDLKPDNVALTVDGTIKVLDFGLARSDPSSPAHPGDPVHSPTITSPMTLTALGVILGTAAYMSPEQARGAVADKRSDVWAFGCVLYEMLSGARAFPGDNVTDTLAAVVKSEPDWTLLPSSVPPTVRALLAGCLEKDRRKRIGDIAAARFVLERAASLGVGAAAPHARRTSWSWLLLTILLSALAVAATVYVTSRPAAPAPVTRFTIQSPAGQDLGVTRRVVALSPDGTKIVFVAGGRLFLRSLSEFDAQPIPGTEAGLQPSFSPDGQMVAFWADGFIKRIALNGGVPVNLCAVPSAPFGMKWTARGVIYVLPGAGIMLVPAAGGSAIPLIPFSDKDGFTQGAEVLPDGDTVLFTATEMSGRSNIWEIGKIFKQSLRTGTRTVLVEGASNATYVPTGHLLYTVEGTLMAVPFDGSKGEITGIAFPVVPGVRRAAPAAGAEAQFAVSATGTLAYIPGPARAVEENVFIYGKDGEAEQLKLPRGTYAYPRVSPDGKWLAVDSHDGRHWVVAVYNLSGTTAIRRLTFGGNSRYPVWASNTHLVYQSDRDGDLSLFRQPVNGGAAERLTRAGPGTAHVPESWSSVHDVLLYSVSTGTSHALWTMSLADRKAAPFGNVISADVPTNAVFSPDGRWVAYQAGDGGTAEATVYVEPYPATNTKYEIARGGRALWTPDGRRLVFVPGPGQLTATTITAGAGTFAFTTPEAIPRLFGLAPPMNPRTFDFLPDGRMVGINAALTDGFGGANRIDVVQNWFEELKARAPSR